MPVNPMFLSDTGQSFSPPGVANADPNVAGGAGDITSGTNPYTGFASRYNPSQLENIWSNPWMILPDVFGQPNMNTAGPGYQALRDIGGDPLTLYNIMAGNDANLASAGTGGYTNWLASLYKSMGQRGGRGFSGRELLRNLFNPSGSESGGQSALYQALTAGDASTQMRTLFQMARDASNVGLNPVAARGYQASLARAGDRALNQLANTNTGQGATNIPIYQLIRQLAPGLVPS